MMEIRAVLFDFIGTTVIEQVPNTISRCFEIAFAMNGIIVTEGFIEANRGKNKREAMELAIEKFNCHAPADRVLRDFESALKDNLHNFTAEPNAQILFHQLKDKE